MSVYFRINGEKSFRTHNYFLKEVVPKILDITSTSLSGEPMRQMEFVIEVPDSSLNFVKWTPDQIREFIDALYTVYKKEFHLTSSADADLTKPIIVDIYALLDLLERTHGNGEMRQSIRPPTSWIRIDEQYSRMPLDKDIYEMVLRVVHKALPTENLLSGEIEAVLAGGRPFLDLAHYHKGVLQEFYTALMSCDEEKVEENFSYSKIDTARVLSRISVLGREIQRTHKLGQEFRLIIGHRQWQPNETAVDRYLFRRVIPRTAHSEKLAEHLRKLREVPPESALADLNTWSHEQIEELLEILYTIYQHDDWQDRRFDEEDRIRAQCDMYVLLLMLESTYGDGGLRQDAAPPTAWIRVDEGLWRMHMTEAVFTAFMTRIYNLLAPDTALAREIDAVRAGERPVLDLSQFSIEDIRKLYTALQHIETQQAGENISGSMSGQASGLMSLLRLAYGVDHLAQPSPLNKIGGFLLAALQVFKKTGGRLSTASRNFLRLQSGGDRV